MSRAVADQRRWPFFYGSCHLLGRALAKLLLASEALGQENIPASGRVIIASNHRSNVDPVLVGLMVPRPVHFMAKEELFANPALRWLVTSLNAFPVRRTGVDKEALRRALRVLEGDGALLMFPEGTRSPDDRFLPPKPGIGLIAARSAAPIVPAYIHNSWRILPKGAIMIRPHKLFVCFGKPLGPEEYSEGPSGPELFERIATRVMQRISELREDLLGKIGRRLRRANDGVAQVDQRQAGD